MAEIITDPATGQQRNLTFREDPDAGMGAVSPQAIARAFQTQKIADAERAVAAAIQFQGMRGYQQALKAGEPAEKALTRYGPMMFYQRPAAFGPAVRAVTPPRMTPYQQFQKEQALKPQVRAIPGGGVVTVDRDKGTVKVLREPVTPPIYRSSPGRGVVRINPEDDTTTTIIEGQPVETPEQRARRSLIVNEIIKEKDLLRKAKPDAKISHFNRLSSLNRALKGFGTPDFSPIEAPAPSKSPYPEGQRLKGPGGKIYVVQNGIPVPE